MLTAALRVYRWDRRTSSISSDRLEPDALAPLGRALAVYRSSIGRARGEVRNAARAALEGLRPDRVEPVVKLLDDAATYEWPGTARSAERRVRVFEAAARRHPVLEAEAARQVLSDTLGEAPHGLEATVAALYADYPGFHRLDRFPDDYTADALRADYDLGQAQALLYSATRVVVDARGDFKHVLRYARLARLIYRLEPLSRPEARPARRSPAARASALSGAPSAAPSGSSSVPPHGAPEAARSGAGSPRLVVEPSATSHDAPAAPAPRADRGAAGYRFTLDGPNSALRRTRAYGVDFARFLAGLVRLRDWDLSADIELRRGWRPLEFRLSAADGLGAYRAAPPDYDSELEAAIAAKFGESRDGWRLSREGAVIQAGGSLIVPDFVFRHEDGTRVVLEIAGYWTPEYIEDKLAKLSRVRGEHLIVAVPKALALRAGALPATVLPFRRRVLLRDLLPRLEAFRR
jgi:predicted nuclease of restriction endonuclease-like RecB superfamily